MNTMASMKPIFLSDLTEKARKRMRVNKALIKRAEKLGFPVLIGFKSKLIRMWWT